MIVFSCVSKPLDKQNVNVQKDNYFLNKGFALIYKDDLFEEEIVKGKKYEELRLAHKENRFDDIDYCKDCDMLYDIPESLVWTNCENRNYGQSIIVEEIFHSSYTK